MALDERQQFKFGFMAACADKGMTLEETRAAAKLAAVRIRAQSTAGMLKMAEGGTTGGSLVNMLSKLVVGGGALGLGLGGAAGGTAGYLAARLGEQNIDPETVKNQEEVAAFQQMADRARRSMQLRRYRDAAPRSPRLFG